MGSTRYKTTKPKVKEVEIDDDEAIGLCYPDGLIEIDPRQSPKDYLDTLVHELLHHHFPDLSEKTVIKISNIMSKAIWNKKHKFKETKKKSK